MRNLLLPLLLTAAALAQAEDLNKMAAQHEAEFKKAMMTGDMGWFERVAAPDYVEYEKPGMKTDRKQSMAMMKSSMAGVKIKTFENKVEKVQPKGKGMVVTTNCHMVMVMPAAKGAKPMVMDAHMRYEETWSKDGGVWKIHVLRTLSDKSTMDGKPMKM